MLGRQYFRFEAAGRKSIFGCFFFPPTAHEMSEVKIKLTWNGARARAFKRDSKLIVDPQGSEWK